MRARLSTVCALHHQTVRRGARRRDCARPAGTARARRAPPAPTPAAPGTRRSTPPPTGRAAAALPPPPRRVTLTRAVRTLLQRKHKIQDTYLFQQHNYHTNNSV